MIQEFEHNISRCGAILRFEFCHKIMRNLSIICNFYVGISVPDTNLCLGFTKKSVGIAFINGSTYTLKGLTDKFFFKLKLKIGPSIRSIMNLKVF